MKRREDVIEFLRGASQGAPRNPLPMDAQQVELRARFDRYMHSGLAPCPGDLIREKKGLGIRTASTRESEALIFVRYLDLHAPSDLALVAEWRKVDPLSTPDCLVWHLHDGEPTVATLLCDSHDLEAIEDLPLAGSAAPEPEGNP